MSLQPFKIGVSCTRNHCFHKCHQTIKSSEIDPKSDSFGAYFGIRSVDLGSNWSLEGGVKVGESASKEVDGGSKVVEGG